MEKQKVRIPFRDLSVANTTLKTELLQAVDKVLTHGQLLLGPEVELFEDKVAKYCGTKYCVGVSSGTYALYLALRSLDIGDGDEVITTPLSWIATLNAIHMCGSNPLFVDIGEDLNINADLIEEAITSRTKALVPVHFTGRLCDMHKMFNIAKKYNLLVIEDAAQAFGAHINGAFAGSFGHVSAFSFNPMKVLPGYGEAGAVVTNSKEIYEKSLALRYLGTVNKEVCYYPSLNAKIDALQAAMILVSMRYLEPNIAQRRKIARYYSDALKGMVRCPSMSQGPDRRSVFFDYAIITERRDALRVFLERCGIEIKIKHPILMPDHPAYKHVDRPELPVAERLVSQILNLLIHEKLTLQDVKYVVESVKAFYYGGV